MLSSWITEFKSWCPSFRVERYDAVLSPMRCSGLDAGMHLRHMLYPSPRSFHGPDRERRRLEAEWIDSGFAFDVCVTTYEMICADEEFFCSSIPWCYVIVDEAHRLKNDKTLAAKIFRQLPCLNMFLLTGTPLQNNLHELWALLNLLLPDVFHSSIPFDSAYSLHVRPLPLQEPLTLRTKGSEIACLGTRQSEEVDHDAVQQVAGALQVLMLRRLKADVETGLPPKTEIQLRVPMSEMQRFWYRRFLQRHQSLISDLGRSSMDAAVDEDSAVVEGEPSTSSEDWRRLLSLVMQLRKCCSHPFLFDGADPPPYAGGEELIEHSGKLKVLDKLLHKLKAENHRVLVFSLFTRVLDILEGSVTARTTTTTLVPQWHINSAHEVVSSRFTALSLAPRRLLQLSWLGVLKARWLNTSRQAFVRYSSFQSRGQHQVCVFDLDPCWRSWYHAYRRRYCHSFRFGLQSTCRSTSPRSSSSHRPGTLSTFRATFSPS